MSTLQSIPYFPRALRASIVVAALVIAPRASFGAQDVDLASIWNDPTFQKQFVGGYGINADVEPRVTPEEVAILEKVRPLMANDLVKAEESLRKQMKPDCSAILDFTLAGTQFQQEKMADALANYQRAVDKFPSFRRAWRSLGLIHVRNGSYEAGIRAFTRMIELGGGDAYAYGLLGFAHAARQDFQPAEAAYRTALLLQPENTEWRLGLTRCVFKQQKYEDTAALLDALLSRTPEKADYWLLQAHAFLSMKRPLDAAGNLEIVDRLGKSTVDSLHTLGDIYLGEKLGDLAQRAYTRAFDLDPQQKLDRPMRAIETLAARGSLRQARELAEHVRMKRQDSLEEGEKRKLLKLEARFRMAEGQGSAETAAVLEEIVRLDPLDGEALMLLGQHYGRQGEQDRAVLYYERAAGLEAFEAQAKVRMAQIYVQQSRYAEALPLLRRAQEVKPREDVARYLEQVERLSKSKR